MANIIKVNFKKTQKNTIIVDSIINEALNCGIDSANKHFQKRMAFAAILIRDEFDNQLGNKTYYQSVWELLDDICEQIIIQSTNKETNNE